MSPAEREDRERPEPGPARDVRRVLRASIDPVGSAILEQLALRRATSGQIAGALGLEVDVVRRWVRKLRRDGLIAAHGRSNPLGHPERLYAIDLLANLPGGAEVEAVPRRLVEEAELAVVRSMFRDAAAAIDAGTFELREDGALIRFPLPLDEEAFKEAALIHRRLFTHIVREVEEARERIAGSAAGPIVASIFVLLFTFPPERWPSSRPDPDPDPSRRRRGARAELLFGLTDPLRTRILDTLLVRPAGAGALGAKLGIPVAKVRYELERLLADGLVSVSGVNPVRGTAERIFVAEPAAAVMSGADVAAVSPRAKRDFSRWLIATLFREAVAAIRGGAQFEDGNDPLLVRITTLLDAQAFAAISALAAASTDELIGLRERSRARFEETGVVARPAVSGLLLFERPRGSKAQSPQRPGGEPW